MDMATINLYATTSPEKKNSLVLTKAQPIALCLLKHGAYT